MRTLLTITIVAGLTALYVLPANARQCSTSVSHPPTYSSSHTRTVYPAVVSSSYAGFKAPVYQDYHKVEVKEVVVPILQPFPFFIDPRISYTYNSGTYVGVPLVPSMPASLPAAHPTPPPAAPTMSTYPSKPPSLTHPPIDTEAIAAEVERRVAARMAAYHSARTPRAPSPSPPSPPTHPPYPTYTPTEEEGPPPVPGTVVTPSGTTSRAPEVDYSSVPAAPYSPSPAARPPATPMVRTAFSVLAGKCGACHTGDGAKGDFQIFASRGVLSPTLDMNAVMDAVLEGRMPPAPRQPLSEQEKRILAGR